MNLTVLAVESDDEDTYTGLVRKRLRAGVSIVPLASGFVGAPAFADHPPSASSPFLAASEGGGGSATRSQETDSPTTLPPLFKQALNYFRSCETEGVDENFL